MVARLQLFNVHNGAPEGDYVLYADYEREIARLTAELAASQKRERVLREAIEKAQHDKLCGWEIAYAPCDCWKRAALGEQESKNE